MGHTTQLSFSSSLPNPWNHSLSDKGKCQLIRVSRFKTKLSTAEQAARPVSVTAPSTAPSPPTLRPPPKLPMLVIPADPSSMPSAQPDSAVQEATSAALGRTSAARRTGARASGAGARRERDSQRLREGMFGIYGDCKIAKDMTKGLISRGLLRSAW